MGVHHVPLFLVVILGSFLQTTQDHPPITVERCQHTNVLLQCNCSEMTHGLKWQKNNTIIYSRYNASTCSFAANNRIKTFQDENPKNCSILLQDITEEDGGEYICIYIEGGIYSKSFVTLKVNINSTQCQAIDDRTMESQKDSFTDPPHVYFAFIIIPALLLFGCIFAVLWKRRNQPDTEEKPDTEVIQPMMKSV